MTDSAPGPLGGPPSRRYGVEDLPSPHPFGERLPGPFAEDAFAQRFVSAFDAVLAPALAVLDCLDAYWDPELAPDDFLAWLAGWVAAGAGADPGRPLPARRRAVARATELHRMRGTARGLADLVRESFGVAAEVTDSGGAAWSAAPGGELPGTAEPWVRVRVRTDDPDALPRHRLELLVEANRPAHVPCTVDVVGPDEG
ncbi:phage tail protein [Streptomyces sp. TRM 70351]|uniref:phage tail protein n=1 Tax=Streptomyces sp. TRM 70351 TaxID=3116552 RepID=UPI002E7B5A35|nr:phage tail protein [Streptomyces sp. TRM 70351]MEE1927541.1 phage tail protein [Streptomyces sp. TRM 70351]